MNNPIPSLTKSNSKNLEACSCTNGSANMMNKDNQETVEKSEDTMKTHNTVETDDESLGTADLDLFETGTAEGSDLSLETDEEKPKKVDGAAFFGYFTMPFILMGTIQYTIHTIVFLKYNTWSMLSAVFFLKNHEDIMTPKQDTQTSNVLLSIHGLVSIGVVGLTLYQVIAGLIAVVSEKRREKLRRSHRRLGYPLAALWILSAVSGTVYMFHSPRLQKEWEEKGDAFKSYFIFALQFPGLMIFANLFNGIRAVIGKTKEARDIVLHTGSMFFVVYWIGFVWAPQLILQFLQVTYLNDCYVMEGPQFKLSYTLVTTIEYIVLIVVGRRYGGEDFRRKFVRYNLIAMAVELGVFWAGLAYVIATDPWDEHDTACLTNTFF